MDLVTARFRERVAFRSGVSFGIAIKKSIGYTYIIFVIIDIIGSLSTVIKDRIGSFVGRSDDRCVTVMLISPHKFPTI